jgi:hypothetical protein
MRWASPFLAGLGMILACVPVQAQTGSATGEIQGHVTSALGEPLFGAAVTSTDQATGSTREVSTDNTGRYVFLHLPPGTYDLAVRHEDFKPHGYTGLSVTVGQVQTVNFSLSAAPTFSVTGIAYSLITEPDRTNQASTIVERYVQNLPIDRRDYLAFSLLAPGVLDTRTITDANDFRVIAVTRSSGLSFLGNNGRGNNVMIDGGEANDAGGGVRQTVSQEAVREFQVNRATYKAEFGQASGGTINVVTKSGTNAFHFTSFGFFRHDSLDAADPFARTYTSGQIRRVEPPSKRQQYGGSVGGPLGKNKTFFYAAYEGLNRDESNAVAVLTDPSIFEPTAAQQQFLSRLPADAAERLRVQLTASASTRELFEANSGVFPFETQLHQGSLRLDHNFGEAQSLAFRYNTTHLEQTNPNALALVGASRGHRISERDHTAAVSWTSFVNPNLANQFRAQFNYGKRRVASNDAFGPEININGFGFFNRDMTLPSFNLGRRTQISNATTWDAGSHSLKMGGELLVHGIHSRSEVFRGGSFSFGPLPASVLSPSLSSLGLTALQAFNLGLAQTYQQGFGDPRVTATLPYIAAFIQDKWDVAPHFVLDIGLRYELDRRRSPVPTDHNNFAPRIGFSWSTDSYRTVVRGGWGIYYSPHYFQVDWVANALNELNGRRQIAQQFTTLQTPGAASAANIFRTLRAQGVIGIPASTRPLEQTDLEQFGLSFSHDGPRPPLSVLFGVADDLVNAYSQQASFGIERELTSKLLVSISYVHAKTLGIVRSRDVNLLPAPIDERLGIPVWTPRFFADPLLLQRNVYESSGRANYHAAIFELERRLADHIGFRLNYTFSKAIDDVVDFNSDFQPNDQTNARAERALSSFDQRHQLVFYGILESPFRSGQGLWRGALADFRFMPLVRANSGQPFNLLVGYDLNQDRHVNTDRPPFAGRNTGRGPTFWTLDLRLARTVSLGEKANIEFMAEGFNVFNRLNFRGVNNVVGVIPGPFQLEGSPDRSPSEPLGFTSAREARRLQLGLRLTF